MKSIFFTSLLTLMSSLMIGQEIFGCLTIDFEDLPDQGVFEGTEISEQYLDTFGVRFILENGDSPVLSEVGFPTTAFGSAWGDDTPAPGTDIGNFFLTDDGQLQGLNSIPLLIFFSEPLDSVGGCILDMDFGEEFILDARDENQDILFTQVITAGDPGTGDGLATCWGFNTAGCFGEIYSIRMEGRRETAGAFGLGLDNLSFCVGGVDINNNVDVDVTPSTCMNPNGAIEINALSSDALEFSLDGIDFDNVSEFEFLDAGIYSVFIRNEEGCLTRLDILVPEEPPILIASDPEDTKCAEENGSIELFTTGENVQFSKDGINFQTETLFDSLPPGIYEFFIIDEFDCPYVYLDTILDSTLPTIESSSFIDESCEKSNGSISFNGIGGTGEGFSYSIGDTSNLTGVFDSISAGSYTLVVTDSDGCTATDVVTLTTTPGVNFVDLETVDPDCQAFDGVVTLNASGGTGTLSYTLDGGPSQNEGIFENLAPGIYELNVLDDLGCDLEARAELVIPLCPIFVPNLFTPESLDGNNFFMPQTYGDYEVGILKYYIYDRWGELVYETGGFSIHDNGYWWDGMFNGKMAELGVYAYLIEVMHENGSIESFVGDVTLVR